MCFKNDKEDSWKVYFQQQKLQPCCTPILTSKVIKVLLLIVGLSFLFIGILLYMSSSSVVELKQRYDNIPECKVQSVGDEPTKCSFELVATKEMKLPIYVYYELTHFYQNHRVYISSLSQDQLTGNELGPADSCKPISTAEDAKTGEDKPIYPCGLMANSFFSDRFSAKIRPADKNATQILCESCEQAKEGELEDYKNTWNTWHEDEKKSWRRDIISWNADNDRFKKPPDEWAEKSTRQGYRQQKEDLYLPDVTDPDFIVWMRPAALPEFRKLYRVISELPDGRTALSPGDEILVSGVNWFSVEEYGGTKTLVFTTLTWFGGKAVSLGITYIVVGGLSLLLALILFVKEPPRSLGNYNFKEFNWKNMPVSEDS